MLDWRLQGNMTYREIVETKDDDSDQGRHHLDPPSRGHDRLLFKTTMCVRKRYRLRDNDGSAMGIFPLGFSDDATKRESCIMFLDHYTELERRRTPLFGKAR